MKILDFEIKGNVIKFYLGDCNDWYGDDWDNRPYEHNAGIVYEQFVKNTIQFAVPFEYNVLEPCSDMLYMYNSPYSKEDMQNRECPCLIISKSDSYSKELTNRKSTKIYFGDNIDLTIKKLDKINAVKLGER